MKDLQLKSNHARVSEKDAVIFVLERFSKIKRSKSINKLIEFQAMNKYMIMAHDQESLKILGNLVASNKKIPLNDILKKYEECLNMALRKEPTVKTHVNVIMHIFGYFAKFFSQTEKETFLDLLGQYKEQKLTLGKILAEFSPMIHKFDNIYLAKQTYFLLYADTSPSIIFDKA